MTMENFINGYPGHEHQFREGLAGVIGQDKADFFFDKVCMLLGLCTMF